MVFSINHFNFHYVLRRRDISLCTWNLFAREERRLLKARWKNEDRTETDTSLMESQRILQSRKGVFGSFTPNTSLRDPCLYAAYAYVNIAKTPFFSHLPVCRLCNCINLPISLHLVVIWLNSFYFVKFLSLQCLPPIFLIILCGNANDNS